MLQTETESHNESVLFKHVRSTVCTVSYYLLSTLSICCHILLHHTH